MKIPVDWAEEAEYAEDKSAGMRFPEERRGQGFKRRDEHLGKLPRFEKKKPAMRPLHAEKHKQAEKPIQANKVRYIEHPRHTGKPKEDLKQTAVIRDAGGTRKMTNKTDRKLEHKHRTGQAVPKAGEHRPREEKKHKKRGPDRQQSLEDRVAYYRKKYGDDFTITAKPSAPKKRKRDKIVDAIKGIFSRKKSGEKL
jgi:hypothetical protein